VEGWRRQVKVDTAYTFAMFERKTDTFDIALFIKGLRVSIVYDNGQGRRMSEEVCHMRTGGANES
jgi:hypothetical protein